MRVLDIGCGVGDVSFLAARLVGPGGSVVGIDRGEESIGTSRRRAKGLGIENVRFVVADVSSFETDEMFDAVIGRLVLLYLPDPSKILQRLSSLLRPGGVMAFQEMDMSTFPGSDSLALRTRALIWVRDAFAAAGAQTRNGAQTGGHFSDCGVSAPRNDRRSKGDERVRACCIRTHCRLGSEPPAGDGASKNRDRRGGGHRHAWRNDCATKPSRRVNPYPTGLAWLARGPGRPEAAPHPRSSESHVRA